MNRRYDGLDEPEVWLSRWTESMKSRWTGIHPQFQPNVWIFAQKMQCCNIVNFIWQKGGYCLNAQAKLFTFWPLDCLPEFHSRFCLPKLLSTIRRRKVGIKAPTTGGQQWRKEMFSLLSQINSREAIFLHQQKGEWGLFRVAASFQVFLHLLRR